MWPCLHAVYFVWFVSLVRVHFTCRVFRSSLDVVFHKLPFVAPSSHGQRSAWRTFGRAGKPASFGASRQHQADSYRCAHLGAIASGA